MEYTGSKYEGDYKKSRMEGKGEYTFPTGTKYKGDMNDGMFHGHGILYFPNGGTFESDWENGIVKGEGKYCFKDGLEYKEQDWVYCTENTDRRFYVEIVNGLRPAGESYLCNDKSVQTIPRGTYDCGEGYFDSADETIYFYDGGYYRKPDSQEISWIVRNCRVG